MAGDRHRSGDAQTLNPSALSCSRPSSVILSGPHGGIQTQLTFDQDPAVQKASRQLIAALEAQKQTIVEKQYEAAKPAPHHYELVPVKSHS